MMKKWGLVVRLEVDGRPRNKMEKVATVGEIGKRERVRGRGERNGFPEIKTPFLGIPLKKTFLK